MLAVNVSNFSLRLTLLEIKEKTHLGRLNIFVFWVIGTLLKSKQFGIRLRITPINNWIKLLISVVRQYCVFLYDIISLSIDCCPYCTARRYILGCNWNNNTTIIINTNKDLVTGKHTMC